MNDPDTWETMNKKFIQPFDSGAHTFCQKHALVNWATGEHCKCPSEKPQLNENLMF